MEHNVHVPERKKYKFRTWDWAHSPCGLYAKNILTSFPNFCHFLGDKISEYTDHLIIIS